MIGAHKVAKPVIRHRSSSFFAWLPLCIWSFRIIAIGDCHGLALGRRGSLQLLAQLITGASSAAWAARGPPGRCSGRSEGRQGREC
jgi:hypothetical protein